MTNDDLLLKLVAEDDEAQTQQTGSLTMAVARPLS